MTWSSASLTRRSTSTAHHQRRGRRPTVEALEGRLLLNAADLDTTFGGTGLVTNSLGYSASAVAVQPNSKVIVAGSAVGYPLTGFGISRYNSDGTLDTSFNGTGSVTTKFKNNSWLNGLALVPGSGDEKVVAVGKTVISVDRKTGLNNMGWAIARYNPNGTLDTTFGDLVSGGKTRTGTTTIDNDTNPYGADYARAAVVQPDGKVVVIGQGGGGESGVANVFEIVRLNSNGTLDTSFNGTGKVVVQFPGGSGITGGQPSGVALDSQGRILVTGPTQSAGSVLTLVLVRLNANGSLDSSFDGDGIAIQPPPAGQDYWLATDVGIQSSGQIVVAGNVTPTGGPWETFLARFNTDGSLDSDPYTGFGPSHTGYDIETQVQTSPSSSGGTMCVQGDDKLVVTAGLIDPTNPTRTIGGFTELRVTAAGLADTTFGTNGLATQFQGQSAGSSAIAMAPDGKIVVAGNWGSSQGQFATIRLMGGSSSSMMAVPAGTTATPFDSVTSPDLWDHVLALLAGSASARKRGAGWTLLAQ
jgi:uncharacterized delta-60 repeat protein